MVTSDDYNQCSESASDVINTLSEITTIHLFVIVDTGCKCRHTAVSNSARAAQRSATQRRSTRRSAARREAAGRGADRPGKRITTISKHLEEMVSIRRVLTNDLLQERRGEEQFGERMVNSRRLQS